MEIQKGFFFSLPLGEEELLNVGGILREKEYVLFYYLFIYLICSLIATIWASRPDLIPNFHGLTSPIPLNPPTGFFSGISLPSPVPPHIFRVAARYGLKPETNSCSWALDCFRVKREKCVENGKRVSYKTGRNVKNGLHACRLKRVERENNYA